MSEIQGTRTADPTPHATKELARNSGRAESPPSEPAPEMVELGITRDGRGFEYNGYRYDRLDDAVRYAQLMRSRPAKENLPGPSVRREPAQLPSVADRDLMAELRIAFEGGSYRFGEFRYDSLSDAVRYATLTRGRADEQR